MRAIGDKQRGSGRADETEQTAPARSARSRGASSRKARATDRLTIADVAALAGVSTGAVSYALNGRPGVSAATRARVLEAARELGWTPNGAARRLAGARSETIGLVLVAQTARTLGISSYYMEFIGGIEQTLSQHGYGLLLQVVPDVEAEMAVYTRWMGAGRVDGVVLMDLRMSDPRVELVSTLGLPAVVVGPPQASGPLACVWTDDGAAMAEAVRYLVALGHRHIGRIAGTPGLAHVEIRNEAFAAAAAEAGIATTTRHGDFTLERGSQATRSVLSATDRPTALLYDDSYIAVASLPIAREMGLDVPTDLSVLAWDDSAVCELTMPPVSAMSHDVGSYGAHVARRLFDVMSGESPVAALEAVPALRVRGTTAAPRRRPAQSAD